MTRLRGLKEKGLLDSVNRAVLVQNNQLSPAKSTSEPGSALKYTELKSYAGDDRTNLLAQKLNQVLLQGRSDSQSVVNEPEQDETLTKTAKNNQSRFKEFEYELLQLQYYKQYGKGLDGAFDEDDLGETQQHTDEVDRRDPNAL